tara:strand:+ start:1056 stop:1670 length:615 start_codon:yes stop_codon:yes gene_type:complete
MEKKNKMAIWSQVSVTNPKYTKEVSFGRKFTSINAQYQIMCATEQFGSCGEGWGVETENFYMVTDGLLGYQAVFWWVNKEEKNHFCINSSIATHNKSGKLDDDCFKKVSTDALTKGLSKLGFSADIFLGDWDDNKYVAKTQPSAPVKESLSSTPKKKLDAKTFKAMIDFINEGKGDIVMERMASYTATETQKKKLREALDTFNK